MAGTYYFITSTGMAIAYDYDDSENTTRNSSKDRNIRNIISGIGNVRGATATDNRIAILDVTNDKIHILDHNWNRIPDEDVTLNSTGFYVGICATNNRWVVSDITNDRLEFWTFAGSEQTSERHSYGRIDINGLFSDGTYIYIVNNTRDRVQRRTYGNPSFSIFISSVGSGDWVAGTSTPSRFVIVSLQRQVKFYNHSGTLQSSEQISLPSGSYQALMAIEDQASATLTLSTTDTDIRPSEQVNINIQSDIDISDFAATDITVRNGTRGTLTRTDARNYVLSVTAASRAGTMTVSIAEDVVSPGNAAVSQNFTINPNPVVKSDLVVSITGTTSIVQGQRTTLTAAVTDADDETLTSGLTYAWTASRGRFIGATDEASAVYEANFTDSSNVAVTITCAVTRPADTAPTSAGASLTALADIGVTGILVNMFMTALGAIASNSNNALYQDGSTGTLASGSDQALSSDITIWRIRWNNDSNRIILNNNASGSLQTYFTANTDKSLYVIFEDGTYVELPQANLVSTGTTWAQWSVTDANIIAKLNALTTISDLLIGIADAGSIGIEANSGSGTATVTATPRPLPAPSVPASLSAAAIDHDSIRLTFSASTGTVTQYQYKIAASQVGLASATWNNGGTGTTIDVHGLTPSTQYYFQVRACNQTVYSAASNTANATTQAAPLPAPSTPGSLSATALDHDTIRLTFSASTGTVTQYQYKVATSSAGLSGAAWNNGGTATTINVDGLTPSTQYYFQVRALNQTVGSAASNTADATTQAPPLVAPSVPGSFAAAVVDHDTVRLTFSASTGTVTQYQYRYATSSAGLSSAVWTDGGTGTTINVDGLSPSTLYYFQVRACNQTVYSAATSAVTATTNPRTIQPLGIGAISSPLAILINTPYELRVPITGNPTEVRVEGDLQYWDYAFNDPMLRLWVTFGTKVTGKTFTISVVDPNDSTNIIHRTVTYNVVSPAPIISAAAAPPMVRDDFYKFFIPVTNIEGSEPVVEGLFTGIGYLSRTVEGIDGNTMEGVLIDGPVADVDRSVNNGVMTLHLTSEEHTVMRDFNFNLTDINYDNLFLFSSHISAISRTAGIRQSGTITPSEVYRIDPIERISGLGRAAVHKNEIYVRATLDDITQCAIIGKTDPRGFIRKSFAFPESVLINIDGTLATIGSFDISNDILYMLYQPAYGTSRQSTSVILTINVNEIENEQQLIDPLSPNRNTALSFYSDVSGWFSVDIAVNHNTIFILKVRNNSRDRIYAYNRATQAYLGFVQLEDSDLIVNTSIACDDNYLYYYNGRTKRVHVVSLPITFNRAIVAYTGAAMDISALLTGNFQSLAI